MPKKMEAKGSRYASQRERELVAEQEARVLDLVLDAMRAGGLSWHAGWSAPDLSPRNPYTGTVYSGRNAVTLAVTAWANGWSDPRWATPGRIAAVARERGEFWDYSGQKTTLVVKYSAPRPRYERDADGRYVLDADGKRKVVGMYPTLLKPIRLLNLSQVEGAPAYEQPLQRPLEGCGVADKLIGTCVCKVGEGLSPKAYYRPDSDEIVLPDRGFFKSVEAFTSTLAHEYVHATGAPGRLDRDMSTSFGSERYAREELVAELGSVLVCSKLGFAYGGVDDVANHAAYVGSWLSRLSQPDGAGEFFRAVSAAQRARDLIVSRYESGAAAGSADGSAGSAAA